MGVKGGEIRQLMGVHEGIRAHLKFLVKSRENLATQDVPIKERIFSYRCGLYDFRDAIRHHCELDERIFKALPSSVSLANTTEEHREIQKVLNDFIELVDSAVIDRLEQEELDQFTQKIRVAFNKIHELIEAHITKENAILKEALEKI
jgi:translation initiation factor 2B subunit (eIF-2B alpha/beta/delta family)